MKITARATLPSSEEVEREMKRGERGLKDRLRSMVRFSRVYEFEQDGNQVRIELDRNDGLISYETNS